MAQARLGGTEYTMERDGANIKVTRCESGGKVTRMWFPPELVAHFAREQMLWGALAGIK